jgi:hypothetical protein
MRRCQQCRQRQELVLLRAPLAHAQLLLRLLILRNTPLLTLYEGSMKEL